MDHVFTSLVSTQTAVQNVFAYWPGMCISKQKTPFSTNRHIARLSNVSAHNDSMNVLVAHFYFLLLMFVSAEKY